DENGAITSVNLSDILSGSKVFKDFLSQFVSSVSIEETVTTLDKKDKGVYTYTSEDKTITNIDIIADVNTNFGDIINNEEVKNLLNQYFKDNVPAGVVTYVKEGDNYVFKYINEKGEAVEIDLASDLINNQEFIDNIINKLGGLYGNVVYNNQDKKFYYIDGQGAQQEIDWSVLDTTNSSFTLEGDFLTITDSKGNTVKLAVEEIASNSTFVTNLAGNKEFVTKLGDNIDFVTNVTNNQEFIDNIINKLEGTYGNVGYDSTTKELYYFDKDGNKVTVDWSDLDTTNSSFTLEGDFLTITDSKGNTVKLAVEEIASNSTFVTNLAGNKEFITKLGDNIEFITQVTENKDFIENIINQLTGTYGNVGFNPTTGDFYYLNEQGEKVAINFQEIVASAETLTSLSGSNLNEEALLNYSDENGAITSVNLSDILSGSKVFKDFLSQFVSSVSIDETVTTLDKKDKGVYTYTSEDNTITNIDIIADVNTNFGDIINNEEVQKILNKYFEDNRPEGSVTYVKQGDNYVFKYINENGEAVEIDLADVIKLYETETTMTPQKYTMYVYMDFVNGQYLEVHEDKLREPVAGEIEVDPIRTYESTMFVYKNEKDVEVQIKGSDLFGATGSEGGATLETVTKLELVDNYADLGKALVYTNEEKVEASIFIDDLFENSETLTTLEAKADTRELVYTNEKQEKTIIPYNDIAQQPWNTGRDVPATSNDQDIYTMGWVGIGYKTKSDSPNEMLRVNGSITATNSYYADYVFESYFDGYSELNYDYKFNDLESVDTYIKNNRHLPGITPISELKLTETGYSFNISELSIQLLEKTEELFLHVIEQQKSLDAKSDRIDNLENQVNDLTKRLEALEAMMK
ncbi:hypothetical protein ACYSNM_09390, partial [Myroides sp. LJL116]